MGQNSRFCVVGTPPPKGRSPKNISETKTIDHVQHSEYFLFKSIEQAMKVWPIEDSHNEAHPDTISPNHNSIASPTGFESNTIDHVQHSGYFLFKSIEPDMKVEPKEDLPNEALPDTIKPNHSAKYSPFESKTIDHVQHSGCFLFKNIERGMKVEPKEDLTNEAHSDTAMSNRNGMSTPNELKSDNIDHVQHPSCLAYNRIEEDTSVDSNEDLNNKAHSNMKIHNEYESTGHHVIRIISSKKDT